MAPSPNPGGAKARLGGKGLLYAPLGVRRFSQNTVQATMGSLLPLSFSFFLLFLNGKDRRGKEVG